MMLTVVARKAVPASLAILAVLALVMATAFATPALAVAVPLVNGGFEAGNNPPTGWTV